MEENRQALAGLGIAIRAALEAGGEIMRVYEGGESGFGVTLKADSSPLTLADKAAHSCISRHLTPTLLPILSEEGRQLPYEERRGWDAFWLVDPLDGTKEFIKRNGEFTVNIALVLNGRPHLGVVYAPERRLLYFAEPLLGAYRAEGITRWEEGMSLPVLVERSARLPFPQTEGRPYVIVSSRSHCSPETLSFIEEARREHPDAVLRESGSSLKICLVAEGSADVYPRLAPTMEWDTGAAHAVACCAGRQIYEAGTDQPLHYNKPDLHNPWFLVR
ncbi:MAG: 3'(2'),5'-bisphosphate nucleotidase CysQ [Prevotellaceae bacterium]|nr:3'(2'),5'-bisphosphate nucleotidase CysQ [Prevotellaceae bacterium]